MILETVTFISQTVSTHWYQTNQEKKIHCKWFY